MVGAQRINLQPGQFIFGRLIAAKETGLTERQIRTCLALLRKLEFLTIKTTNKFSIITIINWHIYQMSETGNDQQSDQHVTSKRPQTRTKEQKNIKDPSLISGNIIELQSRYTDQELINQAFQAISSTRKTKRIADSVKARILSSWNCFPANQVQAGIRTYLEKEYFKQEGKDEKYLLGIIRKTSEMKSPEFRPSGSRSHVLEAYKRGDIKIIAEAGK